MSARVISVLRTTAISLAALLWLLPADAAARPHYAAIGKQETQRLAGQQFAALVRRFDSKMKAALPANKLSALWSQIVLQAGPFRRITAVHSVVYHGDHVIVVTVAFAHARLDVRWSITSQGKIAGLFFAPAAAAAKTAGTAP